MLEQRERDSSTTYERDKDKILTERETERKCAQRKKEEILGEDEKHVYERKKKKKKKRK